MKGLRRIRALKHPRWRILLYTTDLALKGLRQRNIEIAENIMCNFIRPTLLWKDWDFLSVLSAIRTNSISLYDRPCFERIETFLVYSHLFQDGIWLTLYDRPCFERIETYSCFHDWKCYFAALYTTDLALKGLRQSPPLYWRFFQFLQYLYTTDLALKGLRLTLMFFTLS